MKNNKSVAFKDSENSAYLTEQKSRKKAYYFVGGFVSLMAAAITAYMLMLPAVTMTSDPICGISEHSHTKDCYEAVTESELEETFSLDNAINLSDEVETKLVCGMVEHTHDDSCYQETTQEPQTQLTETESDSWQYEETYQEEFVTDEVALSDYQNLEVGDSEKYLLTTDGDNKTIHELKLYYKCSDSNSTATDWTLVADENEDEQAKSESHSEILVHGDDELKLEISYKNVHLSDIKSHNYKIYYQMPDWMESADDSQTVSVYNNSNTVIGTATTETGYMVVTFNKDWIDGHINDATYSTLSGTLQMQAKLDADHIHSEKISLGNIEINVDYKGEDSWLCEYGTLNIEKSDATYIDNDTGDDYLQYTLTVTAGSSGMPAVSVKDYFTASYSSYIDGIAGVTSTETSIEKINLLSETSTKSDFTHGTISYVNNQLVWNIGRMDSNEVRTLTYNVKFKENYANIHKITSTTFTNRADAYSNDTLKNFDTSNFTHYGFVPVYKNQLDYVADADGIGGTITYAVQFRASESNTYVVKDMKVCDYFLFSDKYDYSSGVDVTLETDSIYLYDGDITKESQINGKDYETIDSTKLTVNTTEDGKFNYFICNVGDFAPGQTKTLIYSVRINDSYYLTNNGEFTLRNRVETYDRKKAVKDIVPKGSNQVGGYYADSKIYYSKWEQKSNAERQDTAQTIKMTGNGVYDSTNSSSANTYNTSSDTSFDVAIGNYKFTVLINQEGELDVTAVDLEDSLGSYMKYIGYLRVDEYDDLTGQSLNYITSTPTSTKWLKIDNAATFNFELKKMGFSGSKSYILTYYTKVDYSGSLNTISTSNSFNMSGTVGSGGSSYTLSKISVTVKYSASVSSDYYASKNFWFYEYPENYEEENADDDFAQGSLYWYIKITGTSIPSTSYFKDGNLSINHKLVKDDSLIGVYFLDTGFSPSNMEELENSASKTKVSEDKYTVDWEESGDSVNSFTISFKNKTDIPNEKYLFIIVKTSVIYFPYANNTKGQGTYKNYLYQKMNGDQDGSTFDSGMEAQYVFQMNGASKSAVNVFTYDGNGKYTRIGGSSGDNNGAAGNYAISGYKTNAANLQMIEESGTYIEYKIEVCKNGNLNGDNIIVSDILPEGLELVFLRNQWFHGGSVTPKATTNNGIEELDNDIAENGDNSEWTRYEQENKLYSAATTNLVYYYNSTTREIRWKLDDVDVKSGGILDFQLVTKIIDEQVLLGLETRTYNNEINITKNGFLVETRSSGNVTLKFEPLQKKLDSETLNNLTYNIKVNEYGEDLVTTSDKITLVDEMSPTLILDVSTVEIKNSKGVDITKDSRVHIGLETENEKTLLKITIPDDEPITITYKVSVNAKPGQQVDISNVAHWEGYAAPDCSTCETKDFSYSLGGTADVSGNASLKIIKSSSEDIYTYLGGATFTIQKAEYNSTTKEYTLDNTVYTGTTATDGTLEFSNGNEHWMTYDTIYCIKETKAPDGYELDETPKYIVLSSIKNTTTYPEEVKVKSGSSTYILYVQNEPTPTYTLPSAGGIGTKKIQIAGLILITSAVVVYAVRRRKRV